MEDPRQQLVTRIRTANNILVTVSRNPSVDQLSALLGLALLLNKQGKHAAAVFSGKVPSTLEFLKPEETFEKNTDSLRDFIIALDKNKADKLRYKVEDNVVRIFITPYKTSITQDDLDFSQGDFNVDLVIALGVNQQEDIDEAIVAHGRILHDATVASITISGQNALGTINWHDPLASSLSELVTTLSQDLDKTTLDEQIATALLTGIVSETKRFSNEKTTSATMSVSAILMAAGANQQLVASKLDGELSVNNAGADDKPADSDVLSVDHEFESKDQEPEEHTPELELPSPDENTPDEEPEKPADTPQDVVEGGSSLITEPPTLGGTLTANSGQMQAEPVTDPFSLPQAEEPKLLDHKEPAAQAEQPDEPEPEENQKPDEPTEPVQPPAEPEIPQFTPPPGSWEPPKEPELVQTPPAAPESPEINETLSDIEQAVQNAHAGADGLDAARDEVSRAITAAGPGAPEPITALNAQPLDLNNLNDVATPPQPVSVPASQPATDPLRPPPAPAADPFAPPSAPLPPPPPTDMPVPQTPAPADGQAQVNDPTAPPPVPPPIPFQFGGPTKQ